MARTVRTKVYKFSELSKQAKKKAIEWYSNNGFDYNWSELTVETEEDNLRELGFIDPKIYFSGFSSQGDGACFVCEGIDFNIFLNGKYKDKHLHCHISHNYRYYFSTSTVVNLWDRDEQLTENEFEAVEKDIKSERERIGNNIYKTLETEWDYLHTDASIIETIEANEYEFTIDGRRF